jgi:hypothetical protein
MVGISTTEHQPKGTTMNARFAYTFEMFLERGYRAFTAGITAMELSKEDIAAVEAGKQILESHKFVFRS